jgi:prepilin peptidase CpaA
MIERILLLGWATTAAVFDARYHRLPNWLTVGGFAVGAVYALLAGMSLLGGNMANAMFAAAIAFLLFFPLYLAGWMGAGDVKLFTAMGMLGGSRVLLPTLFISSIVAGIGALVLLRLNRKNTGAAEMPAKRPLPYGVGLALGFAVSVLDVLPPMAGRA